MGKQVIVYFEDPLPEDWKRLGEMIQEGYRSGINSPPGMTWKLTFETVEDKDVQTGQ